MTVYQSLMKARDEMRATLEERKLLGEKMAITAAKYESAKAHATLELKGQGYAATIIDKVIKGMPAVNDALLERDLAKVEYDNATEALNILKRDFDFLRDEYRREWTQSGSDY